MSGTAARQHITTSASVPIPDERTRWRTAFRAVRTETESRAAPLSAEDQIVQSMPDASPTKWHRAHTTWFFEQFLLVPHLPSYRIFDEDFAFLFNSYYVAAGPRHARPAARAADAARASMRSRPIARMSMLRSSACSPTSSDSAACQIVAASSKSACNHEQQHQELLLTDILHAFAQNPIASGL